MGERDVRTFLSALSARRPHEEVAVAEQITRWATERGFDPSYEPRKQELRFRAHGRWVFAMFAQGDLIIQLRTLVHAPIFVPREKEETLIGRLRAASQWWVRPPEKRGFPNILLSRLRDSSDRERLLETVAWIQDQLGLTAQPSAYGRREKRISAPRKPTPLSMAYVEPARPRYEAASQILIDVDQQERRSQQHWELQKILTDHLRKIPGVRLLMADSRVDPLFDVAWEVSGQFYVAEVKSLPPEGERQQMRLGLGQVLHYQQRYLDERNLSCRPVLFVEREPDSPLWDRLCQRVGIVLCTPTTLDRLAGDI